MRRFQPREKKDHLLPAKCQMTIRWGSLQPPGPQALGGHPSPEQKDTPHSEGTQPGSCESYPPLGPPVAPLGIPAPPPLQGYPNRGTLGTCPELRLAQRGKVGRTHLVSKTNPQEDHLNHLLLLSLASPPPPPTDFISSMATALLTVGLPPRPRLGLPPQRGVWRVTLGQGKCVLFQVTELRERKQALVGGQPSPSPPQRRRAVRAAPRPARGRVHLGTRPMPPTDSCRAHAGIRGGRPACTLEGGAPAQLLGVTQGLWGAPTASGR